MRSVRAPRVLVSILLLAAPTSAAAENVFPPVIRLYDGSATDARTRADAMQTAAAIVAQGGVEAAWHDCTPAGAIRRCDPVRAARDLIIRILPTADRASLRPHTGAVRAGAVDGRALGFAVVVNGSEPGVLATIFMDRVEATARRTGIDPAVLLGRAIAHEAGHLLLRTNGHARSGLMREIWTDEELSSDRHDDWLFTAEDRRQLRASTCVGPCRDESPLSASLRPARPMSTAAPALPSSGGHSALEITSPAAETGDVGSTR